MHILRKKGTFEKRNECSFRFSAAPEKPAHSKNTGPKGWNRNEINKNAGKTLRQSFQFPEPEGELIRAFGPFIP